MPLTRTLSVLGLRFLAEGACRAVGGVALEMAGEAAIDLLARRLGDESKRFDQAITSAHERAWKALEIALAGDSFWQRCQRVLARGDDRAFREQVRLFLDSVPAGQLPADQEAFRGQCLQELRNARKAGLLRPEPTRPRELAEQTVALTLFTDPQGLFLAERQLTKDMADELRAAGYDNLARLLTVGDGPSLLVVATRYFLRREVEEDERLSRGLTFSQLETLGQGQEQGFAALHAVLAEQGAHVEEMLGEVQTLVTETHTAVLDVREELLVQGERNQELYEAVLALQRRFNLMQTEVRPSDSLSIRGEAERRMVKELVARYRALPEEQRKELPALLNAVGKLEVAVGSFQGAGRDFATVASLVEDPHAQAEAHHNAYRAALESRDWPGALRELFQAVRLDGRRFAPFPVGKYQPRRILGAGGFGVAFLCRHKYMDTHVVVKTLFDEELDRGIDQLFAEAQALRRLNHPGIVQVQDCGYTDPASRSRPFLVMDYFEGVTLEDHIAANGTLAAEQLLPLARQVGEALLAAHEKGILHRDVKPQNLLVQEQGGQLRAQLIDFGLALRQGALAKSTRRSGTLMGATIAGTLDYAAPEQMGKLAGAPIGPPADIYGFAKTCGFALFGTTQPVLRHWRSIPEPLAELLGGCLAEDPHDRPADFQTVLDCLERLDAAPPEPVTRRAALPTPHRQEEAFQEARPDPRPDRRAWREREEDDWESEEREEPGVLTRKVGGLPVWMWGIGAVCGFFLFAALAVAAVVIGTSSNPTPGTTPGGGPGAQQAGGVEGWQQQAGDRAGKPGADVKLQGKPVYLTDLKEAEAHRGFGGLGKGGNLPDLGRQPHPVKIDSRLAPKALSMRPWSLGTPKFIYNLARTATALRTWAAIDDSSGVAKPGYTFTVLGDGKELWKSTTVVKGKPEEVLVDIRGVGVLQLQVEGKHPHAYAVWVDPCVWVLGEPITPPAPPPPPPTPPPTKPPEKPPEKPPVKPSEEPSVKPPVKPEGTKAYLTDLKESEVKGGMSWLGRSGNLPTVGKKPVSINGRPAPKALSMEPISIEAARVTYHLRNMATALETWAAIDDSSRASGTGYTFTVLGDGKELWKSTTVVKGKTEHVLVDLRGVDVLQLQVAGNGPRTYGVWIDPCVWVRDPAAKRAGEGTGAEAEGNTKYLTDLKEQEVKAGFSGLGRAGKLPTEGGKLAVKVDGKEVPKALTMVPFSRESPSVKYDLDKKGIAFRASVAIDDSSRNAKPAYVFAVIGDGKLLWRSTLVAKGRTEEVRVDVRGVKFLELGVVGKKPDAYAVWIDPRVEFEKGEKPADKVP
jgi:serine/threonine protein kinase